MNDQIPATYPNEAETKLEAKAVPKLSLLKPKCDMTIGDYLRNYTLEVFAVLFWVYTLVKLFLFDIDTWAVVNVFPDYSWVLNFKLIFVLALASLTWLWVGTRDFIVWFLYITFFPLVLVLIRLPYFIFKQKSWLLAFATLNAVASFFKNLRQSLIFTTLFLAAFAVAIFGREHYILPIAACALTILVLVSYIRSFVTALKPTVVFQIYSKFFKGVRSVGYASFELDVEIKDLPVERMEPKQLEKWNTSLQASVLFNRSCLFAATRLRDYQKSEWRIIPSIFSLLWLVAFAVFSFSGVHYALFRWDPTLYDFNQNPTYFTFLYYSFNNLILNSTPEISPAMTLSQGTYMVQASLSFLLVVILATLYISHRAERSSSELDEVIKKVEAEAESMEGFIQSEYKMPSVAAAIDHLAEMKTDLMKFIYWLSKGITK